jgi:hypothetical protein
MGEIYNIAAHAVYSGGILYYGTLDIDYAVGNP